MAYMGIDVGTSGCKAFVYDLEGNVLCSSARKYKEGGSDGHRELDPGAVLTGVQEVLAEIGARCGSDIEAMAVTSLGESVVCLDEEGRSLAPSMVTGDKRGIEENKRLTDQFGAERILEITGLPPSEMYGLPKYMWLNENTPAVRQARAILFYEDYISHYLTGRRVVSYSSASRSMAFDITKKAWSRELLAMAGIGVEQMSTPAEAGTIIGPVRPEIAAEYGFAPGALVVTGGHDQSCAALGSGLSDPETGECGMGTCEFIFLMLKEPPRIDQLPFMTQNDFTCVPYMLPGTYLTSLEVTTCGILKNWARDTVLNGVFRERGQDEAAYYSYLDQRIRGLKTDVLLLPQFGSSGNPDINFDVSGTITGLTIHTQPEEIYAAMLEGMALQMYLSYERVRQLGVNINRMIVTGGGAASDAVLQMRADVFDLEVATITSGESGTLGCMLLAATALGKFDSLQQAIRGAVKTKKTYTPNRDMHAYCRKKFEKFKVLYNTMHLF